MTTWSAQAVHLLMIWKACLTTTRWPSWLSVWRGRWNFRLHSNPLYCQQTRSDSRCDTQVAYIPGPMFVAGYFDLGMGRGPIARDPRLRNDHPINVCSQLIPMVDTSMSPPARDKYPSGDWRIAAEATTSNSQQHTSGIHFRGPNGGDNPYITGCTDCLVCGKSVEQIQDEAVIDYLHKTAIRGESVEQFNARRLAFLEGMKVGCLMLIPGRVSQASACDGNVYSICHNHEKVQPYTLPLN